MKLCEEYDLPETEFEDTGSSFIVTLRRSKLTKGYLEKMDLKNRQRRAIRYVEENKKITNKDYRELTGVTRTTAKRDLADLVDKGIFIRKGKGKGAYYTFRK